MANSRLIWADSLKGWLMLLVILGHAIQKCLGAYCNDNHIWNLIYSFHMPAFMAVSGWLAYKNVNVPSLLLVFLRRCSQLLIPYFVWTVVSFIMKGEYTIQNVGEMLLYPDRSFWFLWVLFWICVIFNFAQLVASKQKVNEMIMLLGTCLLLLGVMVAMEIRVLGFQFLAYYFLFYTLGYCLHKYENSVLLKVISKPYLIISLTILWALLAWGWTMHGLPSWMPAVPHIPSSLLQYAYRGFTGLVAIVLLIGIAPKILNGTGKLNQFICTIGVVSLGLYVVHLSMIGYIVDGIKYIMPTISTWTCVTISFFVTFATSFLIVWLLNMNKYTAKIFLGKL